MNLVKTHTILNISIHSLSRKELLQSFNSGVLFTTNIDHCVKLQHDKEFYQVYKQADWVICDSKILNVAAKFLGCPFKEVIPGSSFFSSFYEYHRDNVEIKIFLLGAAEGVALKAMKDINEKIGRNIVIGAQSPSFGFEKKESECLEIIEIINKSGANVLVVGVGAPKQEKWIMKHKHLLTMDAFMALGATIDFEAGNIKRAPKIYQNMGLEWLYRLIKEPRRLWKRYLVNDMSFFLYLLRTKMGRYKKGA